jgi:hypothetical protein
MLGQRNWQPYPAEGAGSAASGGGSAGVLATQSVTNPMETITAPSTNYTLVYTPKTTGTLTVSCSMSVLASGTGLPITFNLINIAPFGPTIVAESGGTIGRANAAITFTLACTKGVPLSPGIQATTPGENTVFSPANGTSITVVEDQAA